MKDYNKFIQPDQYSAKLDNGSASATSVSQRNAAEKDFKDIWLFRKDLEIKDLSYTDGEVVDSKWVTIDEFEKMIDTLGGIELDVPQRLHDQRYPGKNYGTTRNPLPCCLEVHG